MHNICLWSGNLFIAKNLLSAMSGSGQRKVLFSCFKRKLVNEIKVAQLAGYVAEHSAYHHGEASLCGTIVGMAQDYCGSNNIALLCPDGKSKNNFVCMCPL